MKYTSNDENLKKRGITLNEICKMHKNKVLIMSKFIIKEYKKIVFNYNEEQIIKNSIPIKVSKKVDKNQEENINKKINSIFSPTLNKISEMIDSGIIEWESVSKDTKLEEILNKSSNINDLFYESFDKLYIYKSIKYNLTLDFIMQLYLFFEKELISFVKNSFLVDSCNVFSALKIIEERLDYKININIKSGLDLYRNIINVYKHGPGQSFTNIINSNPELLKYKTNSNDMTFVFDLDKVNIEKLNDNIISFFDELYEQITHKEGLLS